MQGLKISNLLPEGGGTCDYKGLNIEMFVPGSQIYPNDEQACYVITNEEDIPKHDDIVLISTAEYEAAREMYIINPVRQPSPEDLQKQIDAMQLALMGMMDAGGAK